MLAADEKLPVDHVRRSVHDARFLGSCLSRSKSHVRLIEVHFGGDAAAFEKTDKRTVQAEQRRYAELQAKLKRKDAVIAEIMEDLIAEKNGRGGR